MARSARDARTVIGIPRPVKDPDECPRDTRHRSGLRRESRQPRSELGIQTPGISGRGAIVTETPHSASC
ncbi:hypothetical protein HMPREF1275_01275 [Propionibacterium sp. KPL1844]|nr:hypothetical protein HMPREF1275_01275 [Propionibacterium sp. KPL1844]